MLTISQAWAKIAEAYEKKIVTGEQRIAPCGFCFAVNELEEQELIDNEQRWAMKDQIDAQIEDAGVGALLWPYSPEGDEHRVLLAGFLSEATK